jgi:hypothetical protein
MLACVHRLAHHPAEERLVWLHDIHRLAEALTPQQAEALKRLAVERRVSAVCADGLRSAARLFRTRLPAGLLQRLSEIGARGHEPSAVFLERDDSRARELKEDLRALDWPDRMRLLYEHAFPSAGFMTASYGVSNRTWLPALYAHRIVRGMWRSLARKPR